MQILLNTQLVQINGGVEGPECPPSPGHLTSCEIDAANILLGLSNNSTNIFFTYLAHAYIQGAFTH
jgi:hypothetical protein